MIQLPESEHNKGARSRNLCCLCHQFLATAFGENEPGGVRTFALSGCSAVAVQRRVYKYCWVLLKHVFWLIVDKQKTV